MFMMCVFPTLNVTLYTVHHITVHVCMSFIVQCIHVLWVQTCLLYYCRDGEWLATGNTNGCVKLVQLTDFTVKEFLAHNDAVNGCR